jgi:hypothetical protein
MPHKACERYVPSLTRKPGCCDNCGLPREQHGPTLAQMERQCAEWNRKNVDEMPNGCVVALVVLFGLTVVEVVAVIWFAITT